MLLGIPLTGNAESNAAELVPRLQRERDELTQLYGLAAVHSGLTAWWVHELSPPNGALAPSLIGGAMLGSSVLAVALLDANERWSYGQPQALVSGAGLGLQIAAAWVWHDTASHEPQARWSRSTRATLIWSSASGGAAIGALRYWLRPSSPAAASLLGSTATWTGVTTGLLTAAFTGNVDQREPNGTLGLALGLEAGVMLGALMRASFKAPSVAWVRWLDAGALVGGVAGGAGCMAATGQPLQGRAPLLGAAAGTVLGITAALFTWDPVWSPNATVEPRWSTDGASLAWSRAW